ncbi:type II toxin-antitoxin system HicB family antitoxin [Paenibacillus sp. NPDC056579]|uniref:type II toxin-antitoxin system HicB family antitoxin n=1 Tax=Paenibacillus sp. NPDC056579 TaxID=3345871 RepID=UPI0036962562
MNFDVLIEEDYASKNFCAYVPALRISALGDTADEAVSNAEDLIKMKLEEMGERVQLFSSTTRQLKVSV